MSDCVSAEQQPSGFSAGSEEQNIPNESNSAFKKWDEISCCCNWAAEESCLIFCIIVEITLWGTITSEFCALYSLIVLRQSGSHTVSFQ